MHKSCARPTNKIQSVIFSLKNTSKYTFNMYIWIYIYWVPRYTASTFYYKIKIQIFLLTLHIYLYK